MNKCHLNTELSSHEGTRCEFNRSKAVIKLGIDVHQEFYVVAMQEGGSNPKPAQRFSKEGFVHWAARLKKQGGKCMRSMKRVGLVLDCNANSTLWGSIVRWFVRKNSMSTTSG